MMKKNLFAAAAAALLVLCGCGKAVKNAEPAVAKSVIADLQTAYNGETNASAKYAMYAEKAAEAGYKDVAAMFRATSKAESIHAARQASVLKKLGVEPKATVKLPAFVSVEEALKDGIKGETYEMTVMYPDFIRNALAEKTPDDVTAAFRYALEAEKEHAKMYTLALSEMASWKTAGRTFYVCTVCGWTSMTPVKVCVLCGAPEEKFEVFK